jgi:protein tyrosine phosphatase (PTP) superfamily phosphohydrolase (DUF442 family)
MCNKLAEIRAFRALDERLGTAGQPTAAQFRAVREAGYAAVINLALPSSTGALTDEGGVVTGLGMSYFHIPVDFQAPTALDFQAFCRVMEIFEGRPVFVHCAANMRVSAFVFLYRVLRQGLNRELAERDLQAVWQPDEVWQSFMAGQLNNRSPGQPSATA